MGINELQLYLESPCVEGGAVSVDLLKIARNITQRQQPHNATNRKTRPLGLGNKLKLIVDAENCLDRLYGGYFSDWVCGGQWNRLVQFLSLLTGAIENSNIELVAVFNGTIENCRLNEWVAEQANVRQKVGMVLKHINTKATPPPKVWWIPPTCLRTSLRMALRHLGVTVMCTMDDHHQEVIAYCRENGFHGLLADDAEYAAFDPPRYFSSGSMKLTYKGSLETKEYNISELVKSLKINQQQLCILSALLGNFLLSEEELQDIYHKIGISSGANKTPSKTKFKSLAKFVRSLPSPAADMDGVIVAILGSAEDKRASKLRQSIQYYLNGTAGGFLKYCTPSTNSKAKNHNNKQIKNASPPVKELQDCIIVDVVSGAGFASETTEQEEETLKNYKLATVNLVMSSEYPVLDTNNACNSHDLSQLNGLLNGSTSHSSQTASDCASGVQVKTNSTSSNSNTSSDPCSPKHQIPQSFHGNKRSQGSVNIVTPVVSPDVLRTASLRHQKGLMAAQILHVLSTQEVRLPCLLEDEGNRDFPPIHDIYMPLRQRVYAVLFNLHHLRYVHSKKKESKEIAENTPQPDVIVREWIYSRSNPYQYPEEVKAEPLPWAVPTLQRLWFGPSVDDKRRRMRALLTCLNSDTPLILNTGYVPQHMLIMACVLRYIMSQDKPVLRRHELDAFLCHAFNVDLMNPQYLQELTLNVVSSRGVQLAVLFMKGVEMALFANDACGAPLPWLMCCPWLYFDGKLFHHTLNRSAHSKNILEVCENHIERVVKVERMRKAILEGLEVNFAKIPMPPQFQGLGMIRPPPNMCPPPQRLPQMPLPPANRMHPAALRPRPIASRGGQLHVAGVVVGSWGPNYGYQHQQNSRQPTNMFGGFHNNRGRGIMAPGSSNFNANQENNRGRGNQRKSGGAPTPGGKKGNNANKKRNNKTKEKNPSNQSVPKHTFTMKTDDGTHFRDVPVEEVLSNDRQSAVPTTNEYSAEQIGEDDAPDLDLRDAIAN